MDPTKLLLKDFSFTPVSDEYAKEIEEKITSQNKSFVNGIINPSGSALNKKFFDQMDKILDFEVFPDDTWVITYPKSGTTWTQELVWLLKNNLDFKKAKEIALVSRFPFVELELITEITSKEYRPTIQQAKTLERPRCIKSHLPVELLPRQIWTVKPKIIFVSRDPRDVVVSYYHHHRLWSGYTGSFEKFFKVFINDRVVYSPYWRHFLTWTSMRNREHILFNTYEEMKANLPEIIRKTASFLNVNLTEEEVQTLNDHLSFKNMKENRSVNYADIWKVVKEQNKIDDDKLQFIRTGKTGDWKGVFNEKMIDEMNTWTQNWLKDSEFHEYPTSFN